MILVCVLASYISVLWSKVRPFLTLMNIFYTPELTLHTAILSFVA